LALIKSYGQILREYRLNPEHKFRGPDGKTWNRATGGLLRRRPVHASLPQYIGKEANRLDSVQARTIGAISEVTTTYGALDGYTLQRVILPVLRQYSGRQLAHMVGRDRRTIDRIRRGQQPHPLLVTRLTALAMGVGGSST